MVRNPHHLVRVFFWVNLNVSLNELRFFMVLHLILVSQFMKQQDLLHK